MTKMLDAETALAVKCPNPQCSAAVDERCWTSGRGTHRARREAAHDAMEAAKLLAKRAAKAGCGCTNHLGHPKQRHKTRETAVDWALVFAPRRGLRGMTFEPYPCPTGTGWHIRTAKAEQRSTA